MEQKRCPMCGYMNHPDMEMCAKCGQNLKGFLSSFTVTTAQDQDDNLDMDSTPESLLTGSGNMDPATKERLLNLLSDEKFAKNLTPELKNKIEKAVAEGRFTVTTTKTYGTEGGDGLRLTKQLRNSIQTQSGEMNEIKSSSKANAIFLAAIGGFIAIIGAVIAVLMMQPSSP